MVTASSPIHHGVHGAIASVYSVVMKISGMTVLLTFLLSAGCASVEGGRGAAEPPPEPVAGGAPVILELFTSQGCSSCPPADRVLSRIGREGALAGRVVPLAFHVDYWNYIGWSDPFSSKEWSDRQSAYATALGENNVYTPQLVVNGRAHVNGSDEAGIAREVARAAAGPVGRVTVAATPAGAALDVAVTADVPEAIPVKRLVAVVAVYENGIETAIMRGENSGRALVNDYVVRRLEPAFELEPTAGARREGRVRVALDPAWKVANLGVVAFLQDPDTLRIYGAGR
jgi:hypothetical protein